MIQGRGRFNCTNNLMTPQRSEAEVCYASHADCSRLVLTVIPGKTYRLRIGSLTSLSALSFQIEVTYLVMQATIFVPFCFYE